MKKRIHVTGAVLVRNGRVLTAQRGIGKAQEGMWEFPGGKIEEGESPKASLARELKEELLCDATVGDFITLTEHEYEFGIVVLSTYFCTLNGTEPTLTEHQEIRWLRPEELSELTWAPADIPTVELLQGLSL